MSPEVLLDLTCSTVFPTIFWNFSPCNRNWMPTANCMTITKVAMNWYM